METGQPCDENPVSQLLTELAQYGSDRRQPAAMVINGLRDRGFSMRKIARETGIPRTTLTRWFEGAQDR